MEENEEAVQNAEVKEQIFVLSNWLIPKQRNRKNKEKKLDRVVNHAPNIERFVIQEPEGTQHNRHRCQPSQGYLSDRSFSQVDTFPLKNCTQNIQPTRKEVKVGTQKPLKRR
jgi:hypothetical protein